MSDNENELRKRLRQSPLNHFIRESSDSFTLQEFKENQKSESKNFIERESLRDLNE